MRGILTNPVYTGKVYAGRVRKRPPRKRHSALLPIAHPQNTGVPADPEEWIPVTTAPAIVSQERFDQAAEKLSRNKSFASRNNKRNTYLLRALTSCGRCGLACGARTVEHYKYYFCNGKSKQIQSGRDQKCPSRYAPADQLDELVWQDLCKILTHPESITDALQGARGGGWLPQELKARQENLQEGRAALKRQLDRLTEAYLGEVIPLAEYRRRRQELERKDEALERQQQQLRAQADQRMELTGVAGSIDDFCARVQSGLEGATFGQKRQLVELLIDRVVVIDDEVEIRYVIPTDPSSEHTRFCHLRTDYFARRDPAVDRHPPPPVYPYQINPLGSRSLVTRANGGFSPPQKRTRKRLLKMVRHDGPSRRDRSCRARRLAVIRSCPVSPRRTRPRAGTAPLPFPRRCRG